ncbi:SKP1-like protein 1 [Salvia hispanica]|uniref:SKP1-like protein 1 n=1 Tax=Salvia hispanica TaxID=49212 RepID=UPI0020096A4E|nr:SKP1-like protein 1 [Salvia hispanica]
MAAVPKTVILVSSDGERFVIAETLAKQSTTIGNIIDDGCCDAPIPIPNVSGKVLAKVIEYLNNHGGGGSSAEKEKKDEELFGGVAVKEHLDYATAAGYLDIKGLVDLLSKKIANIIKTKEVEEVRTIFGIENDYTPAEEEAIRKQYAWAY